MKVYLDNAATTRLDKRVEQAMRPYYSKLYANASSIHEPGQNAYLDLIASKESVAKILGTEARSIIYTSSATEANNLIIKGFARANKNNDRKKIIISEIEHPCVREAANSLKEEGFEIIYLKPNNKGL